MLWKPYAGGYINIYLIPPNKDMRYQKATCHVTILDYGSLMFVLLIQSPSNFSVASVDQADQHDLTQ